MSHDPRNESLGNEISNVLNWNQQGIRTNCASCHIELNTSLQMMSFINMRSACSYFSTRPAKRSKSDERNVIHHLHNAIYFFFINVYDLEAKQVS